MKVRPHVQPGVGGGWRSSPCPPSTLGDRARPCLPPGRHPRSHQERDPRAHHVQVRFDGHLRYEREAGRLHQTHGAHRHRRSCLLDSLWSPLRPLPRRHPFGSFSEPVLVLAREGRARVERHGGMLCDDRVGSRAFPSLVRRKGANETRRGATLRGWRRRRRSTKRPTSL